MTKRIKMKIYKNHSFVFTIIKTHQDEKYNDYMYKNKNRMYLHNTIEIDLYSNYTYTD